MRRASVLLAVALCAAGGAGCSAYRDPSIVVRDVHVGEVTDEALTLQFALDLANPNAEPLELLEFEYEVSVDGVRVYEGKRAAQATLGPEAARQVSIPAVVRYDRVGWEVGSVPPEARYTIDGRLQYTTPGEIAQILFDTGVRRPRVGFEAAGAVGGDRH